MKVSFRHGIIKYQTDLNNNPDFLLRTSDNYITLYANSTPTLVTISHGDTDYLIEEPTTVNKAWGPFSAGPTDYWLYWDINISTGLRSFGSTTIQPVVNLTAPTSPLIDQHWYDKSKNVMKVWSGTAWIEVLRVFAAKLDNGVIIQPYPTGSQVGSNTTVTAGSLLFDNNNRPVRKTQLDGKGKFLTTESPFHKQFQTISTVKFETTIEYVSAIEHIPAFSLVTYSQNNTIGLASCDPPFKPVVGIIQDELHTGELGIITPHGYVTNLVWNWNLNTYPANTPLFCGPYGEIVTTPPSNGIIQNIGYIVNSNTIYLEKSNPVHHWANGQSYSGVPLEIDVFTGKIITNPHFGGATPQGVGRVYGLTHNQTTHSAQWVISHTYNSTNFLCQVYDSTGHIIMSDDIYYVDNNTIIVSFNVPQTGKAQITFIK
jgi:hypothetical protein